MLNKGSIPKSGEEFPSVISQGILKPGLKITIFQNVLTFIPIWPEARDNAENIR